jgi:hypothetical protein
VIAARGGQFHLRADGAAESWGIAARDVLSAGCLGGIHRPMSTLWTLAREMTESLAKYGKVFTE